MDNNWSWNGLDQSWIKNARRTVLLSLIFVGFVILSGMGTHLKNTSGLALQTTVVNEPTRKGLILLEHSQWPLKAFIISQLASAIPGGLLSYKYPANRVFGIAIAGSSLLHFILPSAMVLSGSLVTGINAIKGLLEGLTYPAVYAMLGFWTVPLERTSAVTVILLGVYFGSFLGNEICFALVPTIYWHVIFYFYGALGLIWTIVWYYQSKERPSLDPKISSEELSCIESSIGPNAVSTKWATIPWIKILKSMPVYAIFIAGICCGCNAVIISVLVLLLYRYNVRQLELTVSVSAPCVLLVIIIVASLCDYLRKHRNVSTTLIRKIVTAGGFIALGVMIPIVGEVGVIFGVTSQCVCYGIICVINGIILAGFMANFLDIAPRYAGILVGVTVALELSAYLVYEQFLNDVTTAMDHTSDPNLIEYRFEHRLKILSLVATVLNFGSGIFYATFASGEQQNWATTSTSEMVNDGELPRENCAEMEFLSVQDVVNDNV